MRKFKRLYQIYKDDFDLEMMMKETKTTYRKLVEQGEAPVDTVELL